MKPKQTFQAYYLRANADFPNPTAADLDATHAYVRDVAANGLEDAFRKMQADLWSPHGEFNDLILSSGLDHTSMAIGDAFVDSDGYVYVHVGPSWNVIGRRP